MAKSPFSIVREAIYRRIEGSRLEPWVSGLAVLLSLAGAVWLASAVFHGLIDGHYHGRGVTYESTTNPAGFWMRLGLDGALSVGLIAIAVFAVLARLRQNSWKK